MDFIHKISIDRFNNNSYKRKSFKSVDRKSFSFFIIFFSFYIIKKKYIITLV